MDEQERYTADEAAAVLQAEGDVQISKRTINYYAFEKKLLEVSETGKRCFTQSDLDKIRAIRLLREHTSFTLEQIKQVIQTRSLAEIRTLCLERIVNISQFYSAPQVPAASQRLASPSPAAPSESFVLAEQSAERTRTIRINADFTLTVSQRVSPKRLRQVVDFIRNVEHEEDE